MILKIIFDSPKARLVNSWCASRSLVISLATKALRLMVLNCLNAPTTCSSLARAEYSSVEAASIRMFVAKPSLVIFSSIALIAADSGVSLSSFFFSSFFFSSPGGPSMVCLARPKMSVFSSALANCHKPSDLNGSLSFLISLLPRSCQSSSIGLIKICTHTSSCSLTEPNTPVIDESGSTSKFWKVLMGKAVGFFRSSSVAARCLSSPSWV